jgi:hypothetical protein
MGRLESCPGLDIASYVIIAPKTRQKPHLVCAEIGQKLEMNKAIFLKYLFFCKT